jgi:hypothetical protein
MASCDTEWCCKDDGVVRAKGMISWYGKNRRVPSVVRCRRNDDGMRRTKGIAENVVVGKFYFSCQSCSLLYNR